MSVTGDYSLWKNDLSKEVTGTIDLFKDGLKVWYNMNTLCFKSELFFKVIDYS
jgi:hypothetical protein